MSGLIWAAVYPTRFRSWWLQKLIHKLNEEQARAILNTLLTIDKQMGWEGRPHTVTMSSFTTINYRAGGVEKSEAEQAEKQGEAK